MIGMLDVERFTVRGRPWRTVVTLYDWLSDDSTALVYDHGKLVFIIDNQGEVVHC